VAVAALLGACGGEASSDSNERAGTYKMQVTTASFPTEQRLGQTSLLRIGIRNTGDKTVPALNVTIGVGGEQGANSSLPFGVRDPQPGLAQPDRPVWVLSATYPRLTGSSEPGGASTADPKTFAFGPLKPGETTQAVWKLSAVRAGSFDLHYRVNAGLGGQTKAVTRGGVAPGGSFAAVITAELPETEVTDSGEVVEIDKPKSKPRPRGE
jgi:hypothetical protein